MCTYCTTKNYRKVYQVHNGPIPIDKNGRRYHIHHIDGDRSNNHYTNLKAVSIEEHYQIHFDQKDWNSCIKLYGQMGKSPEDISMLARQLSKQYGWKPPSQKGKKYWTNGIANIMSLKSPGEGWTPGKTLFCDKDELKKKHSDIKKSQMTTEKREILRQRSLSNRSMPPSQKGKHRWTNGKENKMCVDCPGDGWYRGLTKKK